MALLPLTAAASSGAAPRSNALGTSFTAKGYRLVSRGTTSVVATTKGANSETSIAPQEAAKIAADSRSEFSPKSPAAPSTPRLATPVAAALPIQGAGQATGFNALGHIDQRLANGGNQFSKEPPDTQLCAGPGMLIEGVNTAFAVYQTDGTMLAVQDVNSFFGVPAEFNRTTGNVGPSTGDVKCYFDRDLQRWFLTTFLFDDGDVGYDGVVGSATGRYNIGIAVSTSADPFAAWHTYLLDGTNDGANGTPSHAGCPCLPDQPLIGADRYGFYVSTNEFGPWPPTASTTFNGSNVYAISKAALAAGTASSYSAFELPALGTDLAYSIQPAMSPGRDSMRGGNGGTEFFMSSGDFNGAGDNKVFTWAMTNTSSLDWATPSLSLSAAAVPSITYEMPFDATQRKGGNTPLRDCLIADCLGFGASPEPYPTIQTNDDRMQQTYYAGGYLWSALNTAVTVNGSTRNGIAWFKVDPNLTASGRLSASMAGQGYVAVANNDVYFPAIAVTGQGKAVMSFTMSGNGYFPSAAYVKLAPALNRVNVLARGVDAQDGFSGSLVFGGDGATRWGDYSGASVYGDTVYFASEWISGGPRTLLANWNTFVGQLRV